MSLLTDSTMESLLATELEKSVLRSAYSRIHDYHDPIRAPVFALLMRELLRIIMDRLSPEAEVVKSSWCIGEPWLFLDRAGGQDKITRKSQHRFALTGAISDEKILEYPPLDCSEVIGDLGELIRKLSKFAHISPGTYSLSVTESNKFLAEVEATVLDYAHKLVEVKEMVGEIVFDIVHEKLNDHVMDAVPGELESLSTRTRVDEIHIEELQEFNTCTAVPVLSGCGSAEVELNYGSGSDETSLPDTYPLTFEVQIDPDTFDVTVNWLKVNTDSFYDDGTDDLKESESLMNWIKD